MHITFFLIVLLGAMQFASFGVAGLAFGALLILLLFACVTLHEFGHALAAQRYGIPVREILLLPIGGVAVLERNPDRPMQELVIAVAGPMVNVIIAIGLTLVLTLKVNLGGIDASTLMAATQAGPSVLSALVWLLTANVLLVLFNLLPAYPMDGGRILRAILGFFMHWSRATRIAAVTGQVMAVGMACMAIYTGNIMLVLVAVLIFFSAGSANVQEQARTVLNTLRVGDAYNKHALVLGEHDRIRKVIDYLLTSYQPDFAVMRGRDLLGIVQRENVLDALSREVSDVSVFEIMTRDHPRLGASLTLDEAMDRMASRGSRVAAVYHGHEFLGLVSAEDIAEAHAILMFMRRQSADSPFPDIPLVRARGGV